MEKMNHNASNLRELSAYFYYLNFRLQTFQERYRS